MVIRLYIKLHVYSLLLYTFLYCIHLYVYHKIPGKQEYETEWSEFTVTKAVQPRVKESEPEIIFLAQVNNGIIRIEGSGLLKSSAVSLDDYNGTASTGLIVHVDRRGKAAKVQFDLKSITPGEYGISIANPGGPHIETDPCVSIRWRRRVPFCRCSVYVHAGLPAVAAQYYDPVNGCRRSRTDIPGQAFVYRAGG